MSYAHNENSELRKKKTDAIELENQESTGTFEKKENYNFFGI